MEFKFYGQFQGMCVSPQGKLFLNVWADRRSYLYSHADDQTFQLEQGTGLTNLNELYGFDSDGNLYCRVLGRWMGIIKPCGNLECFQCGISQKNMYRRIFVKENSLFCLDTGSNLHKIVFDSTSNRFIWEPSRMEYLPGSLQFAMGDDLQHCFLRLQDCILKYDLQTRTKTLVATDSLEVAVDNMGVFQLPIERSSVMKYYRGCLYLCDKTISVVKMDLTRKTIIKITPDSPITTEAEVCGLEVFRNLIYVAVGEAGIVRLYTLGVPWKKRRLLWIGQMKESGRYCWLARLPAEMILHIDSYLQVM